jgi:DnaJ-class molecular chaperone
MYCELHRAPTDNDGESEAAQILVEEESSKIVRTRECDKCEHEFFMTAPNMKYCEECSTKGGVRVKVPSHSKH